jgi:hypothetical protein
MRAVYFGTFEPGNNLHCCGSMLWRRLTSSGESEESLNADGYYLDSYVPSDACYVLCGKLASYRRLMSPSYLICEPATAI